MSVSVGGTGNTYKWYKNNLLISGATSSTYTLTNVTSADDGVYTCRIKNSSFPSLTLLSENKTVTVSDGPSIPDWYITTVKGKNVILFDQPAVASPVVHSGYAWVASWRGSSFDYISISNTYALFTDIPDSDGNYVEDIDAKPATRTYKYKVKVKDASDVYSAFSEMQQSVHLSINEGLGSTRNLIWTSYLGKTVDWYEVWASEDDDFYESGTKSVQLATFPNTDNSFTDLGTTVYDYYLIATNFSRPEPLKSGYGSVSKSNVFSILDGFTNTLIPTLKIYPNPVTDEARLVFDNAGNNKFTLRVMDLSGKIIREQKNITGTEFDFKRNDLPMGVYILQLYGERSITAKIVIK